MENFCHANEEKQLSESVAKIRLASKVILFPTNSLPPPDQKTEGIKIARE